MTFASVPALRLQPDLAERWLPKVLATEYDPRNVGMAHKAGVTLGMAMTEKQGGTDVRANTTKAYPVGASGPGQAYELVGHKWFCSAPMCDAFLTLAQTDKGLTCFLLPRHRPDDTRNQFYIQRLKNKLGNCSNASSEVEFRGALAWMVGEEGRGVPTIIEMVAMTRFDCMVGSSALMRQALTQASHHCAHRKVGGKLLSEQPLMQNVLADLALESESALALSLRMGRALDHLNDEHEAKFARLVTAVGKYWICKRAPAMINEAAECMGVPATSKTASCRACTAKRRSTRPGKAPATCNAWMCCAPCPRSPACWRYCSMSWATATATSAWPATSTNCTPHSRTPTTSSTAPGN